MPVDTVHADYRATDYNMMRTVYNGQRAVKAATTTYLPKASGVVAMEASDNSVEVKTGQAIYKAYVERANFVSLISPTVEGMVGLAHKSPWKVELPRLLEYLQESVTPDGRTMDEFSEYITRELLVMGRFGMFADIGNDNNPYIKPYTAECITNWRLEDNKANRIILKEVENVESASDEFAVDEVITYRVLDLVDGVYRVREYKNKAGSVPNTDFSDVVELDRQGLQTGAIPFAVAGSRSTDLSPDDAIPLMPMAEHLLSAYRLSADYKQALHTVSAPTMYVFGIEDDERPTRTGAGTIITSSSKEAKAGYIETSGNGIDSIKTAIDEDIALALMHSHNLAERGKAVESGEALAVRIMTRTASLRSVILNGSYALQDALRHCADWKSQPREQCIVTPNLDFSQAMIDAALLTAFSRAVSLNAMPEEVMFDYLRKAGVTELEDTEIKKLIEKQREEADERSISMLESTAEIGSDENDDDKSDDNKKAA